MGILGKDILRIVLYGIGLGSIASLIYFAGPLVAFGDWRPLENPIIRDIALVVLMAAAAGAGGFTFYRRRKGAEQIAGGIAGEAEPVNDEPVLKERMKDALATLKTASGGKSGYLYDLPWYVIIGPPGAGKTTALVNSGLKFPLSQGSTPAAVAGIGGTRYCDWWFTEEAVLIDTAGRYTTQDSDAKSDKQSWLSFLDLLKKNRPRQPINGVVVAISVEDLLTLPAAEITAHANAIRSRLLELHQRLKVDFPVYALFTKTDLVAGFTEYFSYLNEAGRRQVWGTTFQTANKKQNLVGEVPNQFDQLLEWLSEDTIDRLQEEPSPNYRVSLFGFPTQMARLKPAVFSFLNQIFEPTRYHVNATLRGFYFTSGTQQGTPIDQLIGSLARSFGAEQVASTGYSGVGKSFFLTDLISKVIIGEADWVSTDRAAIRRALILKTAALSLVGLVFVGLSVAWLTSFKHNRDLIDQDEQADQEYAKAAGPAGEASRHRRPRAAQGPAAAAPAAEYPRRLRQSGEPYSAVGGVRPQSACAPAIVLGDRLSYRARATVPAAAALPSGGAAQRTDRRRRFRLRGAQGLHDARRTASARPRTDQVLDAAAIGRTICIPARPTPKVGGCWRTIWMRCSRSKPNSRHWSSLTAG